MTDSILLKNQIDLINKIINYAKAKKLSIRTGNNLLGFGLYEDFYMFYIRLIDYTLIFRSRVCYQKEWENNIIELEVSEHNIEQIFNCIDFVYEDFLKHNSKLLSDEDYMNINEYIDCFAKEIRHEEKEDIEPVEFSKLSLRARHALEKAGINTVSELLKFDLSFLKDIEFCGRKTIIEITEFVDVLKNQNLNTNNESFDVKRLFEEVDLLECLIDYSIDKSLMEKYQKNAKKIEEIFLSWKINNASERDQNIFRQVVMEGKTLQTVGDIYNLSRERINQISKKIKQRYIRNYIYYNKNPLYISEQKKIYDILVELNKEEYLNFLYYGFFDTNLRLKELIYSKCLGFKKAQALMEYFKKCNAEKKKNDKDIKKDDKEKVILESFLNKIVFSSKKTVNEHIETKKDREVFKYMLDVKALIEGINSNIDVIVNPNIAYNIKNNEEYTPDLLLVLEDGRCVLTLLIETLKFAMDYNKTRIETFKKFCEENGFGSLIINYKLQTYDEILEKAVNTECFQDLDKILETDGCIVWKDIKKLKESKSLTNYDLVSYVDKNNYKLYLKPFFIKKR